MRFLLSIGTRSFGFGLVKYLRAVGVSIRTAGLIIPNWDCKDDARSAICGSVLYPDVATVGFDNSFSNRQPHANSSDMTARWAIVGGTIESFEDALTQGCRNAWSLILHCYLYH